MRGSQSPEPSGEAPDALDAPESIVPSRRWLSERSPVASFLVRVPATRLFEVACATEPRLFHRAFAGERTARNFFTSAGSGRLRGGGDHRAFLIPVAQMRRFAGAPRLYYALATFPDGDGGRSEVGGQPRCTLRPESLDQLPYLIVCGDLSSHACRRRALTGGLGDSVRIGGVAAAALRWGGDLSFASTDTATPTGPAVSAPDETERRVGAWERTHAASGNIVTRLTPGGGQDDFAFEIPAGLKMARWEVQVLGKTPGSGYEVVAPPARGGTGRQRCGVRWHYAPGGRIAFRFSVYASPSGVAPQQAVIVDQSGWDDRAKDLFHQGIPTSMELRGEKAQRLAGVIQQEAGRRRIPLPAPATRSASQQLSQQPISEGLVAGVDDAIVLAIVVAVVVLGLAVIAALCFAMGLVLVGLVMKTAIEQGYEVIDANYGFGSTQHGPIPLPGGGGGGGAVPGGGGGGAGDVGGGQTHALGFKLRKKQ